MLDDAINNYYDGQKNEKDFFELKQKFGDNPDFYKTLNIHQKINEFVIKERENIVYPEKLYDELEDRFMMMYLNLAQDDVLPITTDVIYKNKISHFNKYFKYVAAVVIIFLSGIISLDRYVEINKIANNQSKSNSKSINTILANIESQEIENFDNNKTASIKRNFNKINNNINTSINNDIAFNQENVISDAIETFESPIALPSNSTPNTTYSESNQIDEITYNSEIKDSQKLNSTNNFNDVEIKTDIPLINEEKTSNYSELIRNSKTNTLLTKQDLIKPNGIGIKDIDYGNNMITEFNSVVDIKLLSMAGYGFASFGESISSSSPILTYSQSLGYDLSSNSSLGIEFGYTEFSVNRMVKYILPPSADIEIGEGNSEPGVVVNLKRTQIENVIWGNIFYEYLFINNEYTSLGGRIGFGFGNYSPLVNSKLYLKQRIFKGFYLTGGIENKTFSSDINSLNNASYISMFNLIYGVQINF